MTRIAVATEDSQVAQHFGHCPSYRLYDVVDGAVTSTTEVANPGHGAGFPPDYVAELGANVMIVGGIGAGAITRFQGHGIELVTGATGSADAAVQRYLEGDLADAGAACAGHEHGEHGCAH